MKYNDNFAQKFMKSFIGKKEEEKNEVKIPHIKVMLKDLIKVCDEDWGMYAFRREPLRGKFSKDEKIELIKKANECGREYARKIREEYGSGDIYELAKKLGIDVDYPQRPNGGGHIIFAQFVNPNKVTVFKDSVDKAVDLIEKENLKDLFLNVNIEEILLAHEIFHYIEEHNGEELFTQREKIRLWKFGPLKNDSNIVCLGEIAGMAFAKELLQLTYSPYILDSFLVYLYHPKVAFDLYNEIININNRN
ncbi:hypothetical protein ACQPUY_14305 [Clostridium nigeriense]|uniref:hypothetical protein n=1 Tax=Clostridium nigeriense TaxID=1805470 RepID=UPI003D33D847